ncbi:hypothetical protein [Nocardia wallacei]|uniref:hypothetical protein n=1 Tax=Nocardia wallacei TaxID=480035 RepID=UPI002457D1AA|nr:hypothetical protein [Nocardia wallacei]
MTVARDIEKRCGTAASDCVRDLIEHRPRVAVDRLSAGARPIGGRHGGWRVCGGKVMTGLGEVVRSALTTATPGQLIESPLSRVFAAALAFVPVHAYLRMRADVTAMAFTASISGRDR